MLVGSDGPELSQVDIGEDKTLCAIRQLLVDLSPEAVHQARITFKSLQSEVDSVSMARSGTPGTVVEVRSDTGVEVPLDAAIQVADSNRGTPDTAINDCIRFTSTNATAAEGSEEPHESSSNTGSATDEQSAASGEDS